MPDGKPANKFAFDDKPKVNMIQSKPIVLKVLRNLRKNPRILRNKKWTVN